MYSAQRTLVKSAPELWGELSDPDSLARRLEHFGEVRTTGLEPEDTVAWEGDRVRGTVRLEPSGWGTKVTVEVEAKETPAPPAPELDPEQTVAALEAILDDLGSAHHRPFSRA